MVVTLKPVKIPTRNRVVDVTVSCQRDNRSVFVDGGALQARWYFDA
jgi:hypothetical protein